MAWLRLLVLAAAATLSLGCMTVEIGFKVAHQKGQEDHVILRVSQRLTDAYVDAARAANEEREQDYKAAGLNPGQGFPVTIQEMDEFRGLSLEDIRKAGFLTTEDDRGYTAVITYTLTEWEQRENEGEDQLLQVKQDDAGTHYIFVCALPEINYTAEDMERFRTEDLGPKPPIKPIDPDKIAEEQGTIAGVIAEGVKMLGLEGTELDAWFAGRIVNVTIHFFGFE